MKAVKITAQALACLIISLLTILLFGWVVAAALLLSLDAWQRVIEGFSRMF